jgi:hypothetical protein
MTSSFLDYSFRKHETEYFFFGFWFIHINVTRILNSLTFVIEPNLCSSKVLETSEVGNIICSVKRVIIVVVSVDSIYANDDNLQKTPDSA